MHLGLIESAIGRCTNGTDNDRRRRGITPAATVTVMAVVMMPMVAVMMVVIVTMTTIVTVIAAMPTICTCGLYRSERQDQRNEKQFQCLHAPNNEANNVRLTARM